MNIKIAGIVNDSIVDGPGLRLSVFAQGCGHNCQGCHNPQTHDINGGYYIDSKEIVEMAKSNPLLQGITLSGGEPFLQAESFLPLVLEIKSLKLDVIIYTGFLWEFLMNDSSMKALACEADYVIDGKFDKSLRTLDMPFVGSSNQRIIDVKATLETGNIVQAAF